MHVESITSTIFERAGARVRRRIGAGTWLLSQMPAALAAGLPVTTGASSAAPMARAPADRCARRRRLAAPPEPEDRAGIATCKSSFILPGRARLPAHPAMGSRECADFLWSLLVMSTHVTATPLRKGPGAALGEFLTVGSPAGANPMSSPCIGAPPALGRLQEVGVSVSAGSPVPAAASPVAAPTGASPGDTACAIAAFYFHSSGSRGFLRKREKSFLFNALWRHTSCRSGPGLHPGRGEIQLLGTAGPSCPCRRHSERCRGFHADFADRRQFDR